MNKQDHNKGTAFSCQLRLTLSPSF